MSRIALGACLNAIRGRVAGLLEIPIGGDSKDVTLTVSVRSRPAPAAHLAAVHRWNGPAYE